MCSIIFPNIGIFRIFQVVFSIKVEVPFISNVIGPVPMDTVYNGVDVHNFPDRDANFNILAIFEVFVNGNNRIVWKVL